MLSARIELERSADFSVSAAIAIPSGVTALFGPSGSGKSTILQVLSGLERGRANDVIEVSLGGEVWQDTSTFVSPERRRVGYVFQQPQLFPHLSVEANLRYGEKRAADRLITYADVDNWLDLAPLTSRPTTKLSGGEAQRVAIGRALMASPRVLLMDEPLGSIDESARMRILPYLARLRGVLDIPIVYVTHSMQEVSYLADNVYRIEAGRIVTEGSVFETSAAIESEEPAAVLELVAAAYDPAYQLARFRLGDAPLYVATQPIEPETRVRIRIPARDVSITRQRPTETSILNVIPTRIDHLEPHPTRASVVARLTAGEHTLVASITKRSVDGLALEVGQHVFAQVKGVALLTDHGR